MSAPPPLLNLPDETDYRKYFDDNYCSSPITTFDGLKVFFGRDRFDDCMFESSNRRMRSNDIFSRHRAERIDWIKATLLDPNAVPREGWDRDNQVPDPNSRVTNSFGDYVVVIYISKTRQGIWKANFKTAYDADINIGRIRSMREWDIKNCR